MNMLEKQVLEERDPYLNEEEDITMTDSREDHWRNISRDRGKIHALRWDVYTKDKEELIKREFPVSVPHPKWGNIFCTCVKDNIIEEKEHYKAIGLRDFYYKLFEE